MSKIRQNNYVGISFWSLFCNIYLNQLMFDTVINIESKWARFREQRIRQLSRIHTARVYATRAVCVRL